MFNYFYLFFYDWEQRKLGEVAEYYDGTHQTPKYTKSGIPFVSVENIQNILGTGKYISEDDFETNFKIKPKKNDILMTRITAGIIGDTAIITNDSPLAYYVSLALIRSKKINFLYLEKYINTPYFKHELHKRIIHTAFPKKINLVDVGQCSVSYPKKELEQKQIGQFLIQLDKSIALHQRKLEKLKQLKQAYLQQLFPNPGETVPKIRFANFEDEWEERKLEDIIISEMKGKAKAEMYGTVSPYLETNYLNGGEVSYVDSPKNVDEDDVIILWDGSQAGTVYHGFKGALGTTLKAYRPKESGKFLYQYLKLKQQVIYDSYRTPNIPHVIKTFTKEFNVHFTCYEEQNKIGIFLNKLDETTALYQSKIDKLKLMKKGFLQKMFI